MALEDPNDVEVGVEEIDQQPSIDEVKEKLTVVPVGILKTSSSYEAALNEGYEQEEIEKTTQRKRKKRSAISLLFEQSSYFISVKKRKAIHNLRKLFQYGTW